MPAVDSVELKFVDRGVDAAARVPNLSLEGFELVIDLVYIEDVFEGF